MLGFYYSFLTQKERDNETGLDYFQARYFSSTQGRFTSTDPVFITSLRPSNPQQLNLFGYVANNPLRYSDPNGLDLYVTGEEADRFVGDLSKATGLKLTRDQKNGKVTIVSGPKKLSEDATRIKALIEDSNNTVNVEAIRDTGGSIKAAPAGFKARGSIIIDYADLDKFGKQKGGTTAGSFITHEVNEAYEYLVNPIVKRADSLGVDPYRFVHEEAIRYENIYRKRVGLGVRKDQTSYFDGNDEVFVIDYTTHTEYFRVDTRKPNEVKSVKVEKKQ